nr:retrovirus-related Pol polyprotein from transposon TNT 1-94 [Tanacetum cinerariifolium]
MMANLSEDIQCAGKENEVNILKSIDEGPFRMGTLRETLTEGTEGALHLGPERPRVYSDLTPEEKERTSSNPRNQATIQDGRVVVQNVQGRQNRGHGNNARGAGHIARNCTQPKRPQNSEYFKDKMLLMQPQENRVALDEEQLLFIAGRQDKDIDEDVDEQSVQDLALNVDNVFQADDCDASDSDYVKDNAMPVVQSNVSSIPNDAYMMILNDMHEQPAQHVSVTTQNNVVDKSLTAKLATYKEQVELYKRRARFELTKKEQKIDEQLRIVITNRNIKEENLKKELHSVEMQLASTINHNKSMVEEVTYLNKDFKQKENKYLEEFLDMKALKEKFEDKLYKQDQPLQTVHMLCKPKPMKMKAEALKEQTTALRPMKALTVYPLNTPATLVPRMLPTKSQVKITSLHLYNFFLEFEKTCKKRITPTGLTEGERGFEQTKKCYLTEVIPFFKTLKEHFKGIQKALCNTPKMGRNEIRNMGRVTS